MTAKPGRWLHAAFASPASARDALDRLSRDGVPAEDIVIRSSAPLGHDMVPAGVKLHSRVFRIAVLGGLLGGATLFSLVWLTSQAYPLPTGGLPIVAAPPTGVITFEGVAMGAILCTVAGVLYECGLPSSKGRGPLDHYLADDCVLVSVRCSEDASTGWAAGALETECS